jgi:hypothetical protein
LGVSLSSYTDGLSIVRTSEEALYQAKQGGGDCIRFGRKAVQLRTAV